MKLRLLILPVAAVIILSLVVYRLRRDDQPPVTGVAAAERQLAPRFELYDQFNQLAKFERYIGRTRIVLIFFEAGTGADADPLLLPLVEHYPALEAAGIQVVAVSTATRYANQQAAERLGREFPFPLLTDIDLTSPVPAPAHQNWGLYDAEQNATQTGLFLIGRDGTVRWEEGRPRPVDDPESVVASLIAGSWPDN